MPTHIGDGDLGVVTPHKDFGSISRHGDGWTLWRRVSVNGRPGHVERVHDDRIGITFDDCRWRTDAWEDYEKGGRYYDILWSDTPTCASHAEACAAMLGRFPDPNPDWPLGDPRYSVSSVTEWFHIDEVEPIGWQLCWGGMISDEHKRGITYLPHPADR